jgi:hypothetical protein
VDSSGRRVDEVAAEAALEAVKAAVELGADVNAANEDGQTAMHMAAFTGADGVVQFLAAHGASVDVQDKRGETPWSMAAGLSPVLRYRGQYGSHESTATLLLRLGARAVTQEELDARAAAAARGALRRSFSGSRLPCRRYNPLTTISRKRPVAPA